jgi:hypothetical protein
VLLMLHALIYALGRTTEDTVLPHTVAALVPQTDATLSGVLLQHADQALRPWQQEVLRPSSPYPPTVRNPNASVRLQQWRRAAERRHPTGRDDLGLVHPADTSRSNLVTPWLCFRGGGFLYFRELLGRRRNQLRCFARLPPCVTRYFPRHRGAVGRKGARLAGRTHLRAPFHQGASLYQAESTESAELRTLSVLG